MLIRQPLPFFNHLNQPPLRFIRFKAFNQTSHMNIASEALGFVLYVFRYYPAYPIVRQKFYR
ncbi:hypothetical protein C4901_00365 [Acidiferrobacter sp. SPIII_3]|nr:hypothetical protein C4901_00365 [Acidiferrobacter sp. SPIII_3]